MNILGCAVVAALLTTIPLTPIPRANAAPDASYRDYALSNDTATFDGEKFAAEREKLGFAMSMMTSGDERAREIERGYVTMFATWAQTTLRVPLGWFAFDYKDNLEDSVVQLPDKTVRIVARLPIESVTFQRERNAFGDLKKTVVEKTRQRLQAQKFTPGTIVLDEISADAFIVRADDVKDGDGKSWSYLERFVQRAAPQERDEWWAKYARGEALSSLPEPLAMSLWAPTASFDKYRGLFDLMVRDQGLKWVREEPLTPEEFVARVPDSAKFVQMADEAVALLKAGDLKAFGTRFPEADEDVAPAVKQKYRQDLSTVLKMLPPTPQRTSITLTHDSDPENPLFRVTFVRSFVLGKIFPSYAVAIERDSKSGKLLLLGVATASLEEIEYAQKHPLEPGAQN